MLKSQSNQIDVLMILLHHRSIAHYFQLKLLTTDTEVVRFIETFITSIIYSIGLISAGSVWAPAIAHMLVNLFFASVSPKPAHG